MLLKPLVFSLPQDGSPESLATALSCTIHDTYSFWLQELSELEQTDLSSYNHPHHGNWAYFPWRKELIHIPEPDEFKKVFFSRNYPLIERQTQRKLWDMQVAIAGLSVGSNIAIELVKIGVRKLKIADFDTLAPSNNNRITGGSIFQIGENKASLLAKKLYELNPYCEIEQFSQGLTDDNFDQFVHGCDIIIDEIDAFPIKNKLRDYIHSEKGKQTILLQGADLGETPIVEIETFDDPKFGGRVHELAIHKILFNNPSKLEATKMLVAVVGKENIPSSFLQNFINIKRGKQTYWAQLGLAATSVGAKMASMVIEIARGNADKLRRVSKLELREIPDPEEQAIITTFNKDFGYLPSIKKTLFTSDEAILPIKREFGERNKLTFGISDLRITIGEIPGNRLTDEELAIIHKARQSYRMWGDDLSFLLNDPTDTHWEEGAWETTHLIASLEGPNDFQKILTLKKTSFSYDKLMTLAEQSQLPLEFAPWIMKDAASGQTQSLWETFTQWKQQSNFSGNLVTASRFSSVYRRKSETELEKEATAITFAAMQLFRSDTLPTDFIMNIITKTSLQKIFSIRQGKKNITQTFTTTMKALSLTKGWKILLDDKNPTYLHFETKVPKYFEQQPMIYMTRTDTWRQSAINLLRVAKEKYEI